MRGRRRVARSQKTGIFTSRLNASGAGPISKTRAPEPEDRPRTPIRRNCSRYLTASQGWVKALTRTCSRLESSMPHDHCESDHPHNLLPSDPELRVKALETVLVKKGLVDPAALDAIIEIYENRVGPRNGARVVAKSWCDDEFRSELLEDASSAVGKLGYSGRQGAHLVAVENSPEVHNVVVCTLCSCYPWPLLGIPPAWYKSDPYRSRMVREPRKVLKEFGLEIESGRKVRVWDSTAEIRYLVVPMRPEGTENFTESDLADWVTRDSMVGTGLPKPPASQ